MARLTAALLGGLGEIGKNMMVLGYADDLVVIDAGLAFPEDEPGIDIVIPDTTYLVENKERLRGIFLTHGHEDHVGALPFVLRQLEVPVFATRLTLGLVEEKLKEHGLSLPRGSRVLAPKERVGLGVLEVELFRVNHSIPDSVGVAVRTPVGLAICTGDWKIDQTPVDGQVADLHRLAEYGDEGVLVLFGDSTNVEREGYTESERAVRSRLEAILREAPGRVFATTFASNVHRLQQVLDAADEDGRQVAVIGRSMQQTLDVARALGYLRVHNGTLTDIEELEKLPPRQQVILTTGSQGEPMSALRRIAEADHRKIGIVPGDTVVFAATPVPGNERMVALTIDRLFKLGARVIYGKEAGVHVSGHASREELKLMINLTRPRFFVPVHGQVRHLIQHAALARELGIPADHVFVAENGTRLGFDRARGTVVGKITAGRVRIDGLGVGDVGGAVLRDREQLSRSGMVVVAAAVSASEGRPVGPVEVVSRGFVYVKEAESLLDEIRQAARTTLEGVPPEKTADLPWVKARVRETLAQLLYDRTGRRPMVVPVILQVP